MSLLKEENKISFFANNKGLLFSLDTNTHPMDGCSLWSMGVNRLSQDNKTHFEHDNVIGQFLLANLHGYWSISM